MAGRERGNILHSLGEKAGPNGGVTTGGENVLYVAQGDTSFAYSRIPEQHNLKGRGKGEHSELGAFAPPVLLTFASMFNAPAEPSIQPLLRPSPPKSLITII